MSNIRLCSTKQIEDCDTLHAEKDDGCFPSYETTKDEYNKLPSDEKEHFMKCLMCGEMFDPRSLDEVLFHHDHKQRRDIPYSGSERVS
jgi:hypothetical protein